MELRRATVDDWRACREVRLRALAQDPSAFCSTLDRESQFDEYAWKQRLVNGFTVLAWNDSVPLATVSGRPDPHEAGGRELVAMWVDPLARGTGLAHALMSSVIEWARSEGAQELALWVAEDNERARHLYEKSGFAATGERDVMRPGTDQIRMRMSLTHGPEGMLLASALR